MMLAALLHRLAHLLAEAGRRRAGRLAMDQPPVQPGRAVRSELPVQIDGRDDANAGLPVAAGIVISRVAAQIIWDAPLVGVDALDDAGPAQRLQPPDMGIDIALIVAAGNAALEFRLLQMTARPIDAVLGDGGDAAVGRSGCRLGRADLDDAADAGVLQPLCLLYTSRCV